MADHDYSWKIRIFDFYEIFMTYDFKHIIELHVQRFVFHPLGTCIQTLLDSEPSECLSWAEVI